MSLVYPAGGTLHLEQYDRSSQVHEVPAAGNVENQFSHDELRSSSSICLLISKLHVPSAVKPAGNDPSPVDFQPCEK
jgi:hypothetical protein